MIPLALAFLLLPWRQVPTAAEIDPRTPGPEGASELTTGGLTWRYDFDTPDTVQEIALGDRGGQVLVSTFGPDLRLFSSFDGDPPTPVWASDSSPVWTGIAAASESDVYLLVDFRSGGPVDFRYVLKLFRSRSSVLEWRYFFPQEEIAEPSFDLSADGETIVSAFLQSSPPATVLRVHDSSTGEALRTISLPYGAAWHFDLCSAGTLAAFSGTSGAFTTGIYDLVHDAYFTVPGSIPERQALSGDGGELVTRLLAPTGNHVLVHVRDRDDFQVTLDVPTDARLRPIDAALSDDGSTLVAGWWDEGPPQRAIFRAYDLPTAAMTMEHVDVSPGGIVPSDVAISADGSRFVASLSGEGADVAPELAVYSKHSSQPLARYPRGGTVFEVEMSPDGRRFAASRAPTNLGSYGVWIELYEVGGQDLAVRGAPRLGSTITFELHGAPGSRAALLRSFSLAPEPIIFPRIGTLHLDPGTLSSIPIGIVPPSGAATYSTVVSTVPGMIGRTLWFQGITSRPRHLTTDFVQLTILP